MKKIIKFASLLVIFILIGFGIYIYKLRSLAYEMNSQFEHRCLYVHPPLISYKNSFLEIADYFNNPEGYPETNIGTAFEDYTSDMKVYIEKENKWLESQKAFINRWDFKLFEPWYIKQTAEYEWKMYEGYRDDAKYMIETFDAGGMTDEINAKFNEARDRRDKYQKLYDEFYNQALIIRDWRKRFTSLPLPEGCNEENTTIPNTSGSIDWRNDAPTQNPTIFPLDRVS